MPSVVNLGSVGCTVNSVSTNCSVAGKKIAINMPATGSLFNVSLTNVQNYRSLAPLSDVFVVTTKTSDGFIMENSTKTIPTNTNSNYLTQLSLAMQ